MFFFTQTEHVTKDIIYDLTDLGRCHIARQIANGMVWLIYPFMGVRGRGGGGGGLQG